MTAKKSRVVLVPPTAEVAEIARQMAPSGVELMLVKEGEQFDEEAEIISHALILCGELRFNLRLS